MKNTGLIIKAAVIISAIASLFSIVTLIRGSSAHWRFSRYVSLYSVPCPRQPRRMKGRIAKKIRMMKQKKQREKRMSCTKSTACPSLRIRRMKNNTARSHDRVFLLHFNVPSKTKSLPLIERFKLKIEN